MSIDLMRRPLKLEICDCQKKKKTNNNKNKQKRIVEGKI